MKIVWPVLSCIIAVGIFISSALTGEVSGYASMTIAELARLFFPISDAALDVLHFLLRKVAHFVVYFALAFCVAHSLKYYIIPPAGEKRRRLILLAFLAWSIASLYGVTDEIHQFFVPGRVAALLDVLINAAGAAAGAAVVVWWVSRSAR